MLVDAHCHLEEEAFAKDLDAVLERAAEAGVTAIVTAGADVASSRIAVALAEKYANVFAAVGIHPHHAACFDQVALNEIRSLAQNEKVVAIGEIGLDFHYADGAPAEVQSRNLLAHLDLAAELGKPVVLHDRDAHRELLEILKQRPTASARPVGTMMGMLHCFSGDLTMARQAVELGYMISFAGNLTFPKAQRLRQVAQELPLDHVLVETDAPYLAPQPRRGHRNEPAYVVYVAAELAAVLGVEASVVAQETRQNSQTLFHL